MTQPEALRLAEQLKDLSTQFKTPSHEKGVCNGAIQELRRLHEVNEHLLEACKECVADASGYEQRTGKKLVGLWPEKMRQAIQKATGETT